MILTSKQTADEPPIAKMFNVLSPVIWYQAVANDGLMSLLRYKFHFPVLVLLEAEFVEYG